MKKILLFIIGIISIIMPTKVFAETATIDWDLDRSIVVHRIINGEYHVNNMPYLTANGKVVYCIEPGVDLEKGGTMQSTYDKSDTSVRRDIKRASLIGYYGYQKFGHNDPKYYMAAQRLIWLEMGATSAWFTYDREGNELVDVSYYENEILKMVNNHDKTPQFDSNINYLAGDEITLTDQNNILKDYEIESSSGNVKIDGNSLKINVLPNNSNNFTLKRKSDNTKTVFYYKNGLQTVASFGFPYDVKKVYNVVPVFGTINLNKLDFDTNNNIPYNKNVSLENAEYTLYDENNNVVDIALTDEYGKLSFTGLIKGNYYIKETRPSKGYNLNEEVIAVTIDKDNIEVNINTYEKVIKGFVDIRKLLDDSYTNETVMEPNIEFSVYDDEDNFIISRRTDLNGKLSFELPYGKYIIKQTYSPLGVTKVKDFEVDIKNNNEILEYTLLNRVIHNRKIKTLPRTGKKDYSVYLLFLTIFLYLWYKYEKKSA